MAAIKSLRLPANLGPRLSWEMRRLWRRLGWAAATGLACLAVAGLALQQSGSLLKRQQILLAELAEAGKAAAAAPVAAPPGDAQGLAAFYAYLPDHEAIPEQLKDLVDVAQKSEVTLVKAEYKAQPETNAAFLRYQITLPVKAEYANVQAFIVNALQALPTLTLDSVIFKREQIEAGDVEARIQFILLVKKARGRP